MLSSVRLHIHGNKEIIEGGCVCVYVCRGRVCILVSPAIECREERLLLIKKTRDGSMCIINSGAVVGAKQWRRCGGCQVALLLLFFLVGFDNVAVLVCVF